MTAAGGVTGRWHAGFRSPERPGGRGGLSGCLAVIGASAAVARAGGVPPAERSAFLAVNRLPESLYVPVYGLMQAGSLGSVFVTAAAARWRGRSRLALTVAVAGTGVWAGAKVVKRCIGRGRPAAELGGVDIVIVRGREQGDLGFPSGHAAVAFCLATLAATELPPAHRWIVWALATAVGAARVYVGAHLPLDVVGGAALGIVAATAVGAARRPTPAPT